MNDPRKVGGRYWSGYWRAAYVVTNRDGIWITIRWDNGREATHCTAWDPMRDRVL